MTSDRSNQDFRSVVRRQEQPETVTWPLVTPLSPSVVFRAEDADALDAVYEGRESGFSYAREGHPNASMLVCFSLRYAHPSNAVWINSYGVVAAGKGESGYKS